ncbi:MAG: Crp/Fnr family transcriptional regulator [Anaerolineales bacterium]|nr:Crp/Fnr family transcriptional regulator [Anaerolineales bacterium]
MSALTEQIGQHIVFSSLSDSDLERLAEQSRPRKYLKGEWLVHCGDVWPFLFWVEEGEVIALKESGEGRSLITTTINAQDIFWGMAFFDDEATMPVALVADKDSRIRLWSREQLAPFLAQNGKMAWELSRQMVLRMRQASEVVENLAFRAVPGRLANLLLERYSGCGESPVARDMTLDQMAAHIGTTREMVCRALYKFADDGAIKINRTEFVIADENLLGDIAHRN